MAKTKNRCPKCGSTKLKYLDRTRRQTLQGERYEKVYKCKACGKIFNVPREMSYGAGTRKSRR